MKKVCLLIIVGIIIFTLTACSNNNVNKNEQYEIEPILLNELDYQYINSEKELININFDINISKYNEKYFVSSDLIIVPFKKNNEEIIETVSASREEHNINLIVNINSPRAGFQPITSGFEYLLFEVEKFEGDMYYKKDNVYLLINNTNNETIYFKNKSSFYDCRVLKNYQEIKIGEIPSINSKDEELIKNNVDSYIDMYLGCYDGYHVWFSRGDSTALRELYIGDFKFVHEYWFELYAFKNKEVKLVDLYNSGILNEYHVYQIYQYYNKYFTGE